jgi:hypothetical protein
VAGVYKGAIPSGEAYVDYLDSFVVLGSYEDAVQECVVHCCTLGREHCQYAWLFSGKCFTIGCTKKNAEKCQPKERPSLTSTYVQLHFPQVEKGEAGAGW